jgi:hypothetical protein
MTTHSTRNSGINANSLANWVTPKKKFYSQLGQSKDTPQSNEKCITKVLNHRAKPQP